MEYQRGVQRAPGTKRAKRRDGDVELLRLLWSLALFLGVFLGKQIYPERVMSIGEEVRQVIGATVDMEESLAALGNAVGLHGVELKDIGAFCAEVFGPQAEEISGEEVSVSTFQPTVIGRVGCITDAIERGTPALAPEEEPPAQEAEEASPPPAAAVPAVGTVMIKGEGGSEGLPEGYTADRLSFGGMETVTPVLGHLNSGFGYRDHPVNGKYLFHGGVDISGNAGDPIRAFGDGYVEYIGEDASYGLYLQLDHGMGIKSFYAHCKQICVKKGQTVEAGETVAYIGATGRATGPHLHLELKCGQLRVDPAWYVEFTQS